MSRSSWASPPWPSWAWVARERPVATAACAEARSARVSGSDGRSPWLPISPSTPGVTPVSPMPSVISRTSVSVSCSTPAVRDLPRVERLVVPAGGRDHGDAGLRRDPGQRARVAAHSAAGQLDDQGQVELVAQSGQFGRDGGGVPAVDDGFAAVGPVEVEYQMFVRQGRAAHGGHGQRPGDGVEMVLHVLRFLVWGARGLIRTKGASP